MLNIQPEWEHIDGNFNAEIFYWSIVTILEDSKEGKAHLDKINECVYSLWPGSQYHTNVNVYRVVFGNIIQLSMSDDSEEESVDMWILRQHCERVEVEAGALPAWVILIVVCFY